MFNFFFRSNKRLQQTQAQVDEVIKMISKLSCVFYTYISSESVNLYFVQHFDNYSFFRVKTESQFSRMLERHLMSSRRQEVYRIADNFPVYEAKECFWAVFICVPVYFDFAARL